MGKRKPTEAFPVGEYILDELVARGWTAADLATRMGGDARLNECVIELMIHCGDNEVLPMKEETARQIGDAFGTSWEVWFNLDRAYYHWRRTRP